MNKIEMIQKKRDEFNARARSNYHQRTLNGTNIKIINKDNQKKRGRKPKDKEVIVKASVGRPRKEITEELIAQNKYGHLMERGPRGRKPKALSDATNIIDTYDNNAPIYSDAVVDLFNNYSEGII
jgi:hypothetical protein